YVVPGNAVQFAVVLVAANKAGCCKLDGYQCCGNGNCCAEYEYCDQDGFCKMGLTPPTKVPQVVVVKIVQYIIKEKVGVLKLAKENNYNDKEANQIDETTEKLIECVNNFGMSLVRAGVQKNDSCILCDQVKTLSDFNTNTTASKDETVAMLKLLYSLEAIAKNATKCDFILKCMSGDSCSQ
ncbi:14032_t:CDS:2, partial [Racocetra fulgida]